MKIRPAEQRGSAELDWLSSRHSFSFGDYHDPAHMGFGPLRVINEDRVVPGGGFAQHGHRDMEIISYVLQGALQHQDSLGNGSVIVPGDVQRMSAGTGIRHSEYNASDSEPVHFLQIWIQPRQQHLQPGYEQKHFEQAELSGQLRLVASADGRSGSLTVHQDVDLYAGRLQNGERILYNTQAQRIVWLQVARGSVSVNGSELKAGDGAALEDTRNLEITGRQDSELLLFDMAA